MQVESNVVADVQPILQQQPALVVRSVVNRDGPERARLQTKLKKMQEEASRLEAQGENLLNTVVDLRKLVKLVEKERSQELETQRKLNAARLDKLETLRQGLKACYQEGGHLKTMGDYWGQFCG